MEIQESEECFFCTNLQLCSPCSFSVPITYFPHELDVFKGNTDMIKTVLEPYEKRGISSNVMMLFLPFLYNRNGGVLEEKVAERLGFVKGTSRRNTPNFISPFQVLV